MSTFPSPSVGLCTPPPDPTKRVDYTQGMVLGVEDFDQEYAYLAGRDQWLARDTIGYGTLSGLRVTVEVRNGVTEAVVSPGTALTPRGLLVRVPVRQCAVLADWLAAHSDDALKRAQADQLKVYVVLSYRDCPTDPILIPGQPCRDEDESMAPSRLTDDFRLELRLDPPEQREEDALRQFVGWLEAVKVVPGVGDDAALAAFEQALRAAAHLDDPPPSKPGFTAPPAATVQMFAGNLCAFLKLAFRVWITELRPAQRPDWWQQPGASPQAGQPLPDREALLLAELDLPLAVVGGKATATLAPGSPIPVNQDARPLVVHLRMLQEWLLCAAAGGAYLKPADTVTPATTFGLAPAAGTAIEYARGDHTHGTPTLLDLGGDVKGPVGPNTVVQGITGKPIQPVPQDADDGKVLTFRKDHWDLEPLPGAAVVPKPNDAVFKPATTFGIASAPGVSADFARADHTHGTPTLDGDVKGALGPDTVVQGITGKPIQPVPQDADDGKVLTFRKDHWDLEALPAAAVVPKPNDAVFKPATTFGIASAPGVSADFARADHTHGTPALTGDVVGALAAAVKVQGIQGTAVAAPNAVADVGNVLTFRGADWAAVPLPAPPPPIPAVTHPAGLPAYSIVAAGSLKLDGSALRKPAYNNLRITNIAVAPAALVTVSVTFDNYQMPQEDDAFQYVIKVLPWVTRVNSDFPGMLLVSLDHYEPAAFVLRIMERGAVAIDPKLIQLMIEVSRFNK
jgi:hypothetical protein